MKAKLLSLLFLRFVPNRTAWGIGLYVLAQGLGILSGTEVCGAFPAVCDLATKASTVLTPWLAISGIRDAARK
jgi:hypothetical protein